MTNKNSIIGTGTIQASGAGSFVMGHLPAIDDWILSDEYTWYPVDMLDVMSVDGEIEYSDDQQDFRLYVPEGVQRKFRRYQSVGGWTDYRGVYANV